MMDTSETYIRMCEKATEIQGLRELYAYPSGDEDIYPRTFVDTEGEWWYRTMRYDKDDMRIEIAVWLPRQDQLQEMILTKGQPPISLIGKVSKYGSIPMWMDTWEQYWLAFVMKEKFGKVWNGEDWVNESP